MKYAVLLAICMIIMIPRCSFAQIDAKYIGKWELKQAATNPQDHPSGVIWMEFMIDGGDSIVSVSKAPGDPIEIRFVEEIDEVSPDYFRIEHRVTYLIEGATWEVFTDPSSVGYTHFLALKLINRNTLNMKIDFQDGRPAKTFILKRIK